MSTLDVLFAVSYAVIGVAMVLTAVMLTLHIRDWRRGVAPLFDRRVGPPDRRRHATAPVVPHA